MLQALGRYARSVDGALAGTAVQVVIDRARQMITYSCAGHLPPVPLQPDGTVHFLDQATDPRLGVPMADVPRPRADLPYAPGATLVLYTDGLVERRGEDIDDGPRRLTGCLRRHRPARPGAAGRGAPPRSRRGRRRRGRHRPGHHPALSAGTSRYRVIR
ncbi:PP2C family protein-serine/threonine phosphatase [Actinoallomurus sp. CA-142502]|uniref:PP2C family protein-serine/threonine phosphatase n=1 Tax=Actinoallomurus sp. CA-142502 TaxID=3239885 RepID=UPI003D8DAFE4